MKAGSAKTRPYKTQGLRQFALLIVFNPFAFGVGKWGESQNQKAQTKHSFVCLKTALASNACIPS